MELIGSMASPYVRRIRIALHGKEYTFTPINVFSPEGRELMEKYSDTGRVPLLVDRELVIWDSYLIARHLQGPFELETEKELVLINELNDAGVQLFQLRKFGTDPKDLGEFSRNNLRRIEKILKHFEEKSELNWDIVGQWLFCALEWFSFRNVFDWKEAHPNLEAFQKRCSRLPEAAQSAPQ